MLSSIGLVDTALPVIKDSDESPKEAIIICVADLEREGSKKLPKEVNGKNCSLIKITS